jgi:hypothetical protein
MGAMGAREIRGRLGGVPLTYVRGSVSDVAVVGIWRGLGMGN